MFFVPRRELRKQTQWGPLDSLSILYVIGEQKLSLSILHMKSAFLKSWKTFIVRMGGWVDGDDMGPLIRLILEYMNKPDVLVSNLVSKIVRMFHIKSSEHNSFL